MNPSTETLTSTLLAECMSLSERRPLPITVRQAADGSTLAVIPPADQVTFRIARRHFKSAGRTLFPTTTPGEYAISHQP